MGKVSGEGSSLTEFDLTDTVLKTGNCQIKSELLHLKS